MLVLIKENHQIKTLSITNPECGSDETITILGNHGALDDGQFTLDHERNVYTASQNTFDYWESVLSDLNDIAYLELFNSFIGWVAVFSGKSDGKILEDHQEWYIKGDTEQERINNALSLFNVKKDNTIITIRD